MTIYLVNNVNRARALEAVEEWAREHPEAVVRSVEIREDFTVVIVVSQYQKQGEQNDNCNGSPS